jgi:hypothetical protein
MPLSSSGARARRWFGDKQSTGTHKTLWGYLAICQEQGIPRTGTLRLMPMERLLGNQPFTIAPEKREDLGDAGVLSCQFTRPALHFQVYDCDSFENFGTERSGVACCVLVCS